MKISEECRPCLIRQMEATARTAGAQEEVVCDVLRAAKEKLESIWDDGLTPPEISAPLYEMTGAMCGSPDPWLPRKVQYTREALKLLPEVAALVRTAPDPFEAAVRVAIAGNVIDFGTGKGEDHRIDLPEAMRKHLQREMLINHTPFLREAVEDAETILYIGDNAGEAVFDRPLLSLLEGRRLVFAARGGPVINDATVRDAALAGVGLHARLLSTGAKIPGAVPSRCSDEFREIFREADLVIAKGQGNYETLSELPREGRFFFLFVVKCAISARQVGGQIGDMVVLRW